MMKPRPLLRRFAAVLLILTRGLAAAEAPLPRVDSRDPVPVVLPDATPIDREALVRRHNPVIRKVDYTAPLTVGNGGFAFTVDITGLQTFGVEYYRNGIPLETLARWCWTTDPNPAGYTLADADQMYVRPDGSRIALPTNLDTPASDWLRRNPRLHPLGELALEWDKPDGTPFTPADVRAPEQTLDLWRGLITSHYTLGGVPNGDHLLRAAPRYGGGANRVGLDGGREAARAAGLPART